MKLYQIESCISVLNLLSFLIIIDYVSSQENNRQKRFWGFGLNNVFGGGFGGGSGGIGGDGFTNYNSMPRISDCATSDGNRTGICVRTTGECTSRGGRALGACYATMQSNNNVQQSPDQNTINNWQPVGVPLGICCFYQATCGGTIINNGTYFRNPNAPSPYTDSRACTVSIPRRRADICQLRLDFLVFDLSRPRDGNCDTDRFVINGQSQNSIIPPICGYNTGQHIYVDLSTTGPVSLNVLSMGNRNRMFDIRVTQIHCASTYRAPPNCLQYHFGVQGTLRSFNYEELNTAAQGYINNMDYSICFKKELGFCTLTYSVPSIFINLNEQNQPQEPQAASPPGRYFNIVPDSVSTNAVGNDQAGAGPYDCPFDYLILAGIRLCGARFNGQLYPPTPNPNTNAEVTDNSTGPLIARFVTNNQEVGRGFNLNYRMNPCLIGG